MFVIHTQLVGLTRARVVSLLVVASALLVGCGASETGVEGDQAGDARGASFTAGGKADGLGIIEGSSVASAVLEIANTVNQETLDAPVGEGGAGLERKAAEGIVAERPFSTLAELDAVPYVGPVALERLYDYAVATGALSLTFVCDAEEAWRVESSLALRDFIQATHTLSDPSAATDAQAAQLRAALAHLGLLEEAGSDPWGVPDDGAFKLHEARLEGLEIDWIQLYVGDTEVGVVFEAGTLNVIAEISDGELLGCRVEVAEPSPSAPLEAPAPVTCAYDRPWRFDSHAEMRDAVSSSVTLSEGSDLSALQRAQIWGALAHLEFVNEGDDFSAAWAASDEGVFELSRVDLEEGFDWIRFYAGDTEVGVVFEAGALDIVAEVSDGELLGCAPEADEGEGEAPPAACAYDTPWIFSSSLDMRDAAPQKLILEEGGALTDLQRAQLWAAVAHLGLVNEGDDPTSVWSASDEGTFELRRLDSVEVFDWIRFYAGDTEVGVVFEVGTLNIVAEISDGDVLGCVGVAPQAPATPPACEAGEGWAFQTSREMRDAATLVARLTQASTLTPVQRDQLWRAAVALEFVAEGDAFDEIWSAPDERAFELWSVEGEASYDWIRFYAGDTEVGVVFEAQSATIVAEISDGDILLCQ